MSTATSASSSFSAQTSFNLAPSGLPAGSSTNLSLSSTFKATLANGQAADQQDYVHAHTYPLAASPVVIDLRSLTDPLGNALTFVRVNKVILKVNSTTDGVTLLVGYATTTSNAWTALVSNPGQITLQAATATNNGGVIFSAPNATGWVVSGGNHLLQLDPGAATFTVDVEIHGRSV